jgi:hypothetical protein
MGENNVWNNRCRNSKAQSVCPIFLLTEDMQILRSLKRIIGSKLHFKTCILLEQASRKFIVSGEGMGVDFRALLAILWLYTVKYFVDSWIINWKVFGRKQLWFIKSNMSLSD